MVSHAPGTFVSEPHPLPPCTPCTLEPARIAPRHAPRLNPFSGLPSRLEQIKDHLDLNYLALRNGNKGAANYIMPASKL